MMSKIPPGKIIERLLRGKSKNKGTFLLLGASDTGKTTVAAGLTNQLIRGGAVGVIDSDIGQSHIGPPGTIGWAVVKEPVEDFSKKRSEGICFVGDISPVGHLLQFTAGLVKSVEKVQKYTELIVIDTPGFVLESAAKALWWTVYRMLLPDVILAFNRGSELDSLLRGMNAFKSEIEVVDISPEVLCKKPEERRKYRSRKFQDYFRNSAIYHIELKNVSLQLGRRVGGRELENHLVSLRDEKDEDLAVGILEEWREEKDILVIQAPEINAEDVRAVVIGDVSVEI